MHFEKRRKKRKKIFSTRIFLFQQRDTHYKFQNGKQLDIEGDTFLKKSNKNNNQVLHSNIFILVKSIVFVLFLLQTMLEHIKIYPKRPHVC